MLPESIEGPPAKQRKRLRKNQDDADDSIVELNTMKNSSFYGDLADNILARSQVQSSSFRKGSDSS